MFALRKFTWIFAALWLLSQSAGFAHHFDEHSAETNCAICIQLQNEDDAITPSTISHLITALEIQRLLPFQVEANAFNHNLSAKARAPPATV